MKEPDEYRHPCCFPGKICEKHGLVLSQLMRTVQKRPGEEGLTKHQPVSFLGVVQVRSCPQLRGLPLEALRREVHVAYMWAWWEKLTNP